jgi:hypothetical protein
MKYFAAIYPPKTDPGHLYYTDLKQISDEYCGPDPETLPARDLD